MRTKNTLEDTKVAIIGGGVAGTTAACFLLKAGAKVTLFERESDVLMRFKAAKHRLIHPHLYDWPRPGWDDQEARVPHMNWRFGSAASIADELYEKFDETVAIYGEQMRIHKNVSKVSYETHSVTAEIPGKEAVSDVFEHIIFAVGPGKESLISQGKGYWSEDPIAALQKNSHETFVIIGTGDGGQGQRA